MSRIRDTLSSFAAALDASAFMRRLMLTTAAVLHAAVVYVSPLASSQLIALALIASPGIAVVFATGGYRSMPGWIAAWYVAIYSHPVMAPVAFVIAETWVSDLNWQHARGLRTITTTQPGR